MDQRDGRICLVCSCEGTMPLDEGALRRGCDARGAELRLGEQMCRSQLDRFLAAVADGRPVTMACTQEAPLFTQEAEAAGAAAPISFVNVREHAGWSAEAADAGPKMAALLAAAAVPVPPVPLVPLKSEGTTLVLGRDEVALAAAERLRDRLDLTLLLSGEQPVEPPRSAEYPILRGRARAATGWLGAFEVVVDGYAAPSPSSRGAYRWGPARDGARSRCDLILDLSGGPSLFPVAELRQGYLRADPDDAAAVERAVFDAAGLVGEFDKPRFVSFDAGLCAHGRNRRTGCTRCLDLCPTGAITRARTAWRSRRKSARAAALVRPFARPVPSPTPCRRRRRLPRGCGRCSWASPKRAGAILWCCCMTRRMAKRCCTRWPGTARGCRRGCCRSG